MRTNSLSWCAWGLVSLTVVLTVRNPYLQAVAALVLLDAVLASPPPHGFPVRTGIALAILPIAFSFLFSRFGDHAVLRLPAGLPLFGGPWTLEALLYGASTGAALFLIVVLFTVLRSRVRTAEVLAILPGFLQRGAGLLSMAMAFVPQTQATLATAVEVRRLRHQSTGWRSAPGLFLPVVLTGLERALQYAESLEARGFGARRRTRYRPLQWSWEDGLLIGSAAITLAGLVLWPAPIYDAYTRMTPQFPGALTVAAIAVLAVPFFFPFGNFRAAPEF